MYELYFDGCSKKNPGEAGCGYIIIDNSNSENIILDSSSIYLGNNITNNYAEYSGLYYGLKCALQLNLHNENNELLIKGDSLLVIKQMQGFYKVKSENLIDIHNDVKLLTLYFTKKGIKFEHIKREYNKLADSLANKALEDYYLNKIKN